MLVLASTAVTTGIFVLAGVLIGGLLTGLVNYVLERRRETASARAALRLLEIELALAGATIDQVVESGRWWPWNFERSHRTWDEHRPEAARVLSDDEWIKVALGFSGIDAVERTFSELEKGAEIVVSGQLVVAQARKQVYEGANALRERMGMDRIRPGP